MIWSTTSVLLAPTLRLMTALGARAAGSVRWPVALCLPPLVSHLVFGAAPSAGAISTTTPVVAITAFAAVPVLLLHLCTDEGSGSDPLAVLSPGAPVAAAATIGLVAPELPAGVAAAVLTGLLSLTVVTAARPLRGRAHWAPHEP